MTGYNARKWNAKSDFSRSKLIPIGRPQKNRWISLVMTIPTISTHMAVSKHPHRYTASSASSMNPFNRSTACFEDISASPSLALPILLAFTLSSYLIISTLQLLPFTVDLYDLHSLSPSRFYSLSRQQLSSVYIYPFNPLLSIIIAITQSIFHTLHTTLATCWARTKSTPHGPVAYVLAFSFHFALLPGVFLMAQFAQGGALPFEFSKCSYYYGDHVTKNEYINRAHFVSIYPVWDTWEFRHDFSDAIWTRSCLNFLRSVSVTLLTWRAMEKF